MEHPRPPDETLGLEEAAELLRLGLKAMKELIDSGEVPAVRLNQKHTVLLRSVLLEYVREEGIKQAAQRRAVKLEKEARYRQLHPPAKRPRRRPLVDLDKYEKLLLRRLVSHC